MAIPTYETSLPVKVDTLYFQMDLNQFSWSPISSIRDAVDQTGQPGEQSIVPTGIWKRHRTNWKMGEGQDYGDEPGDSEDLQFFQSRGVDPWDQRKLKLLADVEQKKSTAETTGKLVITNSRIYWLDGTTLRYDTSPESATGFTDTIAGTWTDIAQYGSKIVAATGTTSRIINGATNNALGSDDCDYILYGNGRLIGMHDNELFEIDSGGTKASLWSHPNSAFVWKGGVSAPNGLYVFGTAGLTSEIYFIGIDDVVTSLFAPYTAAPLVPNEEVHALYHYGGVIVIGTERGFRLANITGNGHLSYGPLVEVGPVTQLAGDGEDLWFTWKNYDGSYTGLGRTRLSKGTDILVPRYASDVMAATQGEVLGAAVFEDRQYFIVSGVGLYGSNADKVATGWVNSGWLTYGTYELKEMHSLDVRHEPLPAGSTVVGKLVKEDASEVTIVTSSTTSAVGAQDDVSPKFTTEQIQVKVELARATDTTTGPELRRWTLRGVPMPTKQAQFILPLVLKNVVKGPRGQEVNQNALVKWNALRALEAARTVVTVLIGDFTVQARIDGVGINSGGMVHWSDNQEFPEGTVLVRFETVEDVGS
jgi:hypothetical protein